MPTTKVYRGYLHYTYNEEEFDILANLNSAHEDHVCPYFAEQIQYDIEQFGGYMSVKYIMSDDEIPIKEIDANNLIVLSGIGYADYGMMYDNQDYLWTEEEVRVGGKDLLEIFEEHIGQFCHLEVTFTKEIPSELAA